MALGVYLNFDGNCKEALEFYSGALGVEYKAMYFKEMPPDPNLPIPKEYEDRVMHAVFEYEGVNIMFSDAMPGTEVAVGDNISLMISLDDADKLMEIYTSLVEGGFEIIPIGKTFWSELYGMFKDKYGVIWHLNLEKEPKE